MDPEKDDTVCVDDPYLRKNISERARVLDILDTEIGVLFFVEFEGANPPTRGYLKRDQLRIAPANDA